MCCEVGVNHEKSERIGYVGCRLREKKGLREIVVLEVVLSG